MTPDAQVRYNLLDKSNKKTKDEIVMAKAKNKKKIIMIIAIVCCVVLVASLITTVILLTRKKFDITPNTTVTYNDHKNMKIISLDTNYSIVNDSSPTYYSNGTVFVKDNVGRLGVFSYNENKLIIPVVHASNTYSTSSGEIQRYPLREFELTTAKYNVDSTNFGLDTTHTEEHIFKALEFYDKHQRKKDITK